MAQTARNLQTLKAILDNTPTLIFVKDLEGRYTLINRAFEKFFDIKEEDLLGRTDYALFPKEIADSITRNDQRVISCGQALQFEESDLFRDGMRYAISSKVPLHGPDGDIVAICGISTPITERKRAEESLIEAKRAAEAANQAKSEFLANMSHEIRTPMNAVLGFTEILKRLEQDPRKSRYIESIHTAARALMNLINDILDLSKVEAGKVDLQHTAVSVESLLEEIETIFRQKIADKGLDLILEIDDGFPKALILDETRLRQVLVNLIGNAIKFTHAGHVRVQSRSNGSNTEDRSSVELTIAVEDTGTGIHPNQQEKIFDAFEQAKGRKAGHPGGTGLGLAISKRLIEMMDGEITVESEVHKGSTFTVTLHDVEIAAAEELREWKGEELDPDRLCFEPATILIADDIDYNRELLTTCLEPFGFKLVYAENGLEAIDEAGKHHPDLILLDIKMPVLDGFEVTECLREAPDTREVPIIALTAHVLKADEKKTMASGFSGFLSKPFVLDDLLTLLMEHLPHTYQEKTGPDPGTVEPNGSHDARKLPGTIAELTGPLLVEWKEISGQFVVNDIEDFATKIIDLAHRDHNERLSAYGSRLFAYAERFDRQGMQTVLEEFPVLVRELEDLL